MSESLQQIDATADRIRAELQRTTAELDRRFHHAVDVRGQLRRHTVGAGLIAAALLAAAGAGIVAVVFRARTKRVRPLGERLKGLGRAWRLAPPPPSRTVGAEVATRVVSAVAGVVAAQVAKRAFEALAS